MNDPACFLEFYGRNLRFPFFTGFLSLGGFLFAAKTFIVVHMKKEVYSTAQYRKRFEKQKKLNEKLKLYAPLRNLSTLLFLAVTVSLATSSLQVTLGLLPYLWAAIACCVFAAVTIALLGFSLYQMWSNMKQWVDDLESEAETSHS